MTLDEEVVKTSIMADEIVAEMDQEMVSWCKTHDLPDTFLHTLVENMIKCQN